jgi:hypothetical protein
MDNAIQEQPQGELPVMLMVLSNEIRRQESSPFANAQKVYYVLDKRDIEKTTARETM